MSWIAITTEDLLGKLTAPEMAAVKTVALDPSQQDPVPDAIDRVTKEVRGYVAACIKNKVGPIGTIPDELVDAAMAMCVVRVCLRLPTKVVLTEGRLEANRQAIRLLERTAACQFELEQPEEVSEQQFSTYNITYSGRTPKWNDQDGI